MGGQQVTPSDDWHQHLFVWSADSLKTPARVDDDPKHPLPPLPFPSSAVSFPTQPSASSIVFDLPTSQALTLSNRPRTMQYPVSTALTIPTARNTYMYGSYPQSHPYGYSQGYPQTMPVYVQPQQQVMYSMPSAYPVQSYGYGGMGGMGGMQMGGGYMPGTSVVIQDPYGYSSRRRHRRHRRHSYGGYPTYY